MADVEQVVPAFNHTGETAEAPGFAQGVEPVGPPGQQLVRVTLMPDVPQQPIQREVENPVQGNGQLGDAQVAGQVPPAGSHRVDDPAADLLGQLR